MELTEDQKAELAAGGVILQSAAVAFGPAGVAAATLATSLVNSLIAADGKEYTMETYKAALAADDVALADDAAAQAAAKGSP